MKKIKYVKHVYGGYEIDEAILSNIGEEFGSLKEVDYKVKELDLINTLWDDRNFSRVNLPKLLFELTKEEKSIISKDRNIRVLDLPIKFPRTNYRIPEELKDFKSLIQKIISNEHKINNKIDDYYCYLTIDNRVVKKDENTRKGGIHVDGFQGSRLESVLPIDHSYIVYNNNPTIFYNQKFEVKEGWCKSCHNYFGGFEKQKNKDNAVLYPNNSVLLFDAYCLHEAPLVERDELRTFIRLSFTVREFDRLGNSHNGMFDYNWDMIPRNMQESLIDP